MGVRGCAWVCMGVRGCAWVCMDVNGCAWVCVDVHGCEWVCVDVHGCEMKDWDEEVGYDREGIGGARRTREVNPNASCSTGVTQATDEGGR